MLRSVVHNFICGHLDQLKVKDVVGKHQSEH